jgi:pimeloyl-ACP methyl ester carboxylesterase
MVTPVDTANSVSMRRTALLAAASLAISVVVPAGAGASDDPQWTPCGTQECTTVTAPMDYDRPYGPTVSLAVSRIRTAKPELRRGVLLLIPGGPGNSGLTRPVSYRQRLPQAVLDRYDLVGFDPRGTGTSTPVSCGLAPADLDPERFLPWPGPAGDISGSVGRARRVADGCVRNGGELVRHISTRTEARDLDRIRAVLGERKLSYIGVSYGTYVGAVYATMFPGHTDRVVLDSNDDPNPRLVERGWLANFAVGAEDRFPDFAAWAAARNDVYGLGDTVASVRAEYLSLAEGLDRAPRSDITGAFLRAGVFNSLYSDTGFPVAAEVLKAVRIGGPLPAVPVPPADQLQNIIAVQTATACNDVAFPRDVDGYVDAVARNRSDFPLTAGMPANIGACAFWPYRPDSAVRVTSRGPDNVLLVQNVRDPATPYSGALKMREAFGRRARVVTVNSGGHGAYLANGNACGDSAVSGFLVAGARQDVVC